jgi:hypothetical protein
MNLLATDLVESGDADDGGSDGAEDEAAGNHGKKGVLEGRGDGSLGDEGVGERGGGARDHGGGELLDLGAVGTGRGRGGDGWVRKYSQLCQLAEVATGVGAEDRARPTRRVLRRSLIASTGASTWYTHGKDRDDRPDTFRDESSNATTRSRARSLVVVQSPLTHKLELIRRIINRSASGDPQLARDSPGDSLHGHSLHRLDTLDCGLERGRGGKVSETIDDARVSSRHGPPGPRGFQTVPHGSLWRVKFTTKNRHAVVTHGGGTHREARPSWRRACGPRWGGQRRRSWRRRWRP